MSIELKSGSTIRLSIEKTINREGARKTLERLFLQDKTNSHSLDVRSRRFVELPKRRGGVIWTKRPNKIHLPLNKGDAATITVTPQVMRDLSSVATFVAVAQA